MPVSSNTTAYNYRFQQRQLNLRYYCKFGLLVFVILALGFAIGWFSHTYQRQLQQQNLKLYHKWQFEQEIQPQLGSRIQGLHGSGMDWQQYPNVDVSVYQTLGNEQLVLVSWSNDRQLYTVMYLPFNYQEYEKILTNFN